MATATATSTTNVRPPRRPTDEDDEDDHRTHGRRRTMLPLRPRRWVLAHAFVMLLVPLLLPPLDAAAAAPTPPPPRPWWRRLGRTTATTAATTSGAATNTDRLVHDDDYVVTGSRVVYDRWRIVIDRTVRMPNGRLVDYDIIDQRGAGAVVVFAWNSTSKTATLVREYHPGCGRLLVGPAAGLIDDDHHDRDDDRDGGGGGGGKHGGDAETAAKWELEEECHLRGGTWYRLCYDEVSVPMDKYVATEITAFLVIDPVVVDDPMPHDEEEYIEILRGSHTVDVIWDTIRSGGMNLVGGWACMLAMEKLRELGEL